MIASLKGKIISKSANEVIIDCGGVGYLVFVSLNTADKLPGIAQEAYLYTILIPRDDSFQLYGFAEEVERDAFRLLTNIPGIGPKIAIGILSSISVSALFELIATNNILGLQKLPGIGKKTAERIVVELKDKLHKFKKVELPETYSAKKLIRDEAISALITLGYSKQVAEKAVDNAVAQFDNSDFTTEELIRASLRLAVT